MKIVESASERVFLKFLREVRPQHSGEGWQSLSFDELALDSLDLTTLCLDLEDALDVEVRVDELGRFQTLGELQNWVSRNPQSRTDS